MICHDLTSETEDHSIFDTTHFSYMLNSMDLVDDLPTRWIPLHRQSFLDFTRCRDPDWLSDLDDYIADKSFHKLLWRCYSFPTLINEWATPKQVEKIDKKLERCARIMNKCLMILREIKRDGEMMGPYEFWERMTDKEIEIIGNYPAFQAWLHYTERVRSDTGIDVTIF